MVIRVGVIGCGAAGLCAGRHMVHSPETYNFVIFEQTSEIGGTWNYTSKTGRDEFDLPIHSSMYKNLRTNIPKEIMGFPDFPFPNSGKSFTHHTQVHDYLREYAKFHELYEKIKTVIPLLRQHEKNLPFLVISQNEFNNRLFQTYVKTLSPEEVPGKKRVWKIIAHDLKSNVEIEYTFDAVLVCNGHFAIPNIPSIENIDAFRGIKTHSHSYREPEIYKNKTVVVLGAGSSGMDISMEISFYAKQIYLSHNLPRHSCKLPGNIIQKPGIKRATEDGFVFLDDSSVTADVLMFCTGYKYNFPFLTEQCKVKIENNRVMPLYKHLIHMDFPELAFVGLPFTVLPFPFFHYQIQYFLKTLDNTIKLPDRAAMEEETEKDYRKRIVDMKMPPKHAHKMGPLQWEYFEDLGNIARIGSLPPVYKMVYDIVEGERKNNIMFYKKENYKVLSGEEYMRMMPEP